MAAGMPGGPYRLDSQSLVVNGGGHPDPRTAARSGHHTADSAFRRIHGRADFMNAAPGETRCGISRFCRLVRPVMEQASVPVALNPDHGNDPETAKICVDNGFSAVMIVGSHLSFEENAALTRQISEYAHRKGVTVEAEPGVLAGREDHTGQSREIYTDPSRVCEFFEMSGADCLARSYGTLHGPAKGGSLKIRKEITIAAFENMRFNGKIRPLVIHGSSLGTHVSGAGLRRRAPPSGSHPASADRIPEYRREQTPDRSGGTGGRRDELLVHFGQAGMAFLILFLRVLYLRLVHQTCLIFI